jgi:hypothetical protein
MPNTPSCKSNETCTRLETSPSAGLASNVKHFADEKYPQSWTAGKIGGSPLELAPVRPICLQVRSAADLLTRFLQISQRRSVAPTVKPAPTAASKTRSPFFILPSSIAVSMARGMVPAEVFPYFSILMIT